MIWNCLHSACCREYYIWNVMTIHRRGSWNFSKGGGCEEEKMFVNKRFNACTNKTRQTCNSLSSFLSRGLSSIFLLSSINSLYFFNLKGGCNPRNPPPLSIRQWFIQIIHLFSVKFNVYFRRYLLKTASL